MICSMPDSFPLQDPLTLVPPDVLAALERVWDGETGDSVESESLELKEDPGCRQTDMPSRGGNPRAQLFEKLINETICFSNSDVQSGNIVVGVSDSLSGPDAFIGTNIEPADVEQKIRNATDPQIRVECLQFKLHGKDLLWIHVPQGLTLYSRRSNGVASRRNGTSCSPIGQEERQRIISRHANPDYSDLPSSRSIDEISAEVIGEIRRLRSEINSSGRLPNLEPHRDGILREIGLVDHRSGILKNAGEILLLPAEGPSVTIRHLWRPLPGAEPRVQNFTEPLLLARPRLLRLIKESASAEIARVQMLNGQEMAVPRFPDQAIDEAITNAMIHRDWRLSNPIVVDQSPDVLKILSPGPLPTGVDINSILVTQSVPRNSRLMAAMRVLGLAEESSRGFDRMWSSMISSGRMPPQVNANENHVEVILSSGDPDVEFIKFLNLMRANYNREIFTSVSVLIICQHLWLHSSVDLENVISSTQLSNIEANSLLETLVAQGILKKRESSSWEWSESVRGFLLEIGHEAVLWSMEEWIMYKLAHGGVTAAQVVERFGVERMQVTDTLRSLRSQGRAQIDASGPQRGPNTRWISVS